MGIFTTSPKTETWAKDYFDALWDNNYDLAVEIRHEAMIKKAREFWNEEEFVMFIDRIEWEEIDEVI